MLWSDAEAALLSYAAGRGVDLAAVDAVTAVNIVVDWYLADPAEGVETESGDMLLLEWGTYGWGQGPSFEYGIVRQLIPEGAVDDDIWQLHVTHHFASGPELAGLAGDSEWCDGREKVPGLRARIDSSAASALVAGATATRVEIYFEQV